MKTDLSGPVELPDRPGRWLIDRIPAREYFTGDFVVEARLVLTFPPKAKTSAQQSR
jgi:hypothetical protein